MGSTVQLIILMIQAAFKLTNLVLFLLVSLVGWIYTSVVNARAKKRGEPATASFYDGDFWGDLLGSSTEAKAEKANRAAAAYAKHHTPVFVGKYVAYYRAGQHSRVPPDIQAAIKHGDVNDAVYRMLFVHRANTGRDHPLP